MTNFLPLKQNLQVIPCAEKNVYGRMLIYVTDERKSRMLAVLTNKTTLDYRDLEALHNLGFEIELTKLPV